MGPAKSAVSLEKPSRAPGLEDTRAEATASASTKRAAGEMKNMPKPVLGGMVSVSPEDKDRDQPPNKIEKSIEKPQRDGPPTFRHMQAMVTILAGRDNGGYSGTQLFMIHRGLLCYYSGYFRKLFENGLFSQKPPHIRHPTYNSVSFGHFIEWCYTQKCIYLDGAPMLSHSIRLCRLYTLADHLDAPLLKQAYDAIGKASKYRP